MLDKELAASLQGRLPFEDIKQIYNPKYLTAELKKLNEVIRNSPTQGYVELPKETDLSTLNKEAIICDEQETLYYNVKSLTIQAIGEDTRYNLLIQFDEVTGKSGYLIDNLRAFAKVVPLQSIVILSEFNNVEEDNLSISLQVDKEFNTVKSRNFHLVATTYFVHVVNSLSYLVKTPNKVFWNLIKEDMTLAFWYSLRE